MMLQKKRKIFLYTIFITFSVMNVAIYCTVWTSLSDDELETKLGSRKTTAGERAEIEKEIALRKTATAPAAVQEELRQAKEVVQQLTGATTVEEARTIVKQAAVKGRSIAEDLKDFTETVKGLVGARAQQLQAIEALKRGAAAAGIELREYVADLQARGALPVAPSGGGTGGGAGEGLANLGNTCYLNASLQELLHLPGLPEAFEGHDSKRDPNGVVALYRALERAKGTPSESKALKALHEKVVAKYFAGRKGHEEDAEEFLTFLFAGMKECGVTFFEYGASNVTKCVNCGTESPGNTLENILSIAVVPASTTIKGCLDEHFKQQNLNVANGNQPNCARCAGPQDATSKAVLTSLPDALVVQLKRFNRAGGKIKDVIEITPELNMAPYCVGGVVDTQYWLQGIIYHDGDTIGAGHYRAAVRVDGAQWQNFNDQVVSLPFTPGSADYMAQLGGDANRTPYVLFYVKKGLVPGLVIPVGAPAAAAVVVKASTAAAAAAAVVKPTTSPVTSAGAVPSATVAAAALASKPATLGNLAPAAGPSLGTVNPQLSGGSSDQNEAMRGFLAGIKPQVLEDAGLTALFEKKKSAVATKTAAASLVQSEAFSAQERQPIDLFLGKYKYTSAKDFCDQLFDLNNKTWSLDKLMPTSRMFPKDDKYINKLSEEAAKGKLGWGDAHNFMFDMTGDVPVAGYTIEQVKAMLNFRIAKLQAAEQMKSLKENVEQFTKACEVFDTKAFKQLIANIVSFVNTMNRGSSHVKPVLSIKHDSLQKLVDTKSFIPSEIKDLRLFDVILMTLPENVDCSTNILYASSWINILALEKDLSLNKAQIEKAVNSFEGTKLLPDQAGFIKEIDDVLGTIKPVKDTVKRLGTYFAADPADDGTKLMGDLVKFCGSIRDSQDKILKALVAKKLRRATTMKTLGEAGLPLRPGEFKTLTTVDDAKRDESLPVAAAETAGEALGPLQLKAGEVDTDLAAKLGIDPVTMAMKMIAVRKAWGAIPKSGPAEKATYWNEKIGKTTKEDFNAAADVEGVGLKKHLQGLLGVSW